MKIRGGTRSRPAPSSKVEYSMSGMPFFQALILLASVIVIIVATQWRQLHPFPRNCSRRLGFWLSRGVFHWLSR